MAKFRIQFVPPTGNIIERQYCYATCLESDWSRAVHAAEIQLIHLNLRRPHLRQWLLGEIKEIPMAKNIKMEKPTKREHAALMELVEETVEFQSNFGSESQVKKAEVLANWLWKYRSAYDMATERR